MARLVRALKDGRERKTAKMAIAWKQCGGAFSIFSNNLLIDKLHHALVAGFAFEVLIVVPVLPLAMTCSDEHTEQFAHPFLAGFVTVDLVTVMLLK